MDSESNTLGDRLVDGYIGRLLFMVALGIFPCVAKWAARGWNGAE